MSKTYQFYLPLITCINCVAGIKEALKRLQAEKPELDITHYTVDLSTKTGSITVKDESLDDVMVRKIVKDALEDSGHEVESFILDPKVVEELRRKLVRKHIIKGVTGLACGVFIMALMISGITIPFFAMVAIIGSGSLLTLFIGIDSYWAAIKNLFQNGRLTMDTMFMVSSLTVIGASIASIFVPWSPMIIESGLIILGFRQLGDGLMESLEKKAALGVVFTDRAVKKVWRRIDSGWEQAKSSQLRVGDIIQVMSGEVIPVDGTCATESTYIQATIKTGDPLPVLIKKGKEILAGMIVPKEVRFINLRVDRIVSQSNLARLANKVELAKAEQAPLQDATVKITQYFVPGVFLLALISGVLVSVFFTMTYAILCTISILVSLCPCILGLIAPRALKMGLSKAIDHGIQFKSEKHLQLANDVNVVFFDMHGTLTKGKPEVTAVHFYSESAASSKKNFRILAEIEKDFNHPIAKAIHQYALSNSDDSESVNVIKSPQQHHSGVSAIVNGEKYCIGNCDFISINYPGLLDQIKIIPSGYEQVIYVVKNGILLSHIKIRDPLRDDAKFVVEELQRQGKTVGIISGASQETVERCAFELGIKGHVYGGKNSEEKAAIIEQFQSQNKTVAMVGDSENDTFPISRCTLGIAVKSASYHQTTLDEAGATIDSASLLPVLAAFAVSKQTVESIVDNLILSLTYNTVMSLICGGVLLPVAGFVLNPVVGAGLMVASAVLILLNQYRLSLQELPYEAGYSKLMDALAQKKKYSSIYSELGHHSPKQSVGKDDSIKQVLEEVNLLPTLTKMKNPVEMTFPLRSEIDEGQLREQGEQGCSILRC